MHNIVSYMALKTLTLLSFAHILVLNLTFFCRTYVSFNEKNRTIGYGAKQQSVTNFKNTVAGFTRIVGRKFNDPAVQSEVKSFFRPNEVSTDKAGNAVIQVGFNWLPL